VRSLVDRLGPRRGHVLSNLSARIVALASLALATLLIARTTGPEGVGLFALLRVLPWLVGVLASAGLFGAAPYFLAGPSRSDRRLPFTILAIGVVAGSVGGLLWAAGSPLLIAVFFKHVNTALVALAGLTVLTQLLESTAKACSQGSDDLRGANRIIALEEMAFVPAYLLLRGLGIGGSAAIVWGLVLSDTTTNVIGWSRLAAKGFFQGASWPSVSLAREVYAFGFRGQVGTVALLLNQRLDFALVSALIGPRALGIYAVASRFAELLRLPSLAVSYVLYPNYAREGGGKAAAMARSMIPKAGWITAAAAVPLALAAGFVIPALYGDAFRSGVVPTYILLGGLAGGGVVGVVSAYLYGVGRPGLNSLGMGAGVVVTVVLDLLLIPRFGIVGAAVASSVAYITSLAVLLAFFRKVAPAMEKENGRAPRSRPGLSDPLPGPAAEGTTMVEAAR
jgi:O-antigen/teichoic acid export membrane protein